jgi:hypothetical protein
MKNTISKKYIVDHIVRNYGEMRHDINKFIYAIRETSMTFELNKKDLFHYIIERGSTISGSQSYGFDTAYGRSIRTYFENTYYEN